MKTSHKAYYDGGVKTKWD